MSSDSTPPPAAPSADDRRRKPRVDVRFKVVYRGQSFEGRGVVRNISESGALIDQTDRLLMVGGHIRVSFSFFENSTPIELAAVVTRETPNGFGVHFMKMNARTRALMNMAIAKLRAAGRAREVDPLADDDEDITLMRVR